MVNAIFTMGSKSIKFWFNLLKPYLLFSPGIPEWTNRTSPLGQLHRNAIPARDGCFAAQIRHNIQTEGVFRNNPEHRISPRGFTIRWGTHQCSCVWRHINRTLSPTLPILAGFIYFKKKLFSRNVITIGLTANRMTIFRIIRLQILLLVAALFPRLFQAVPMPYCLCTLNVFPSKVKHQQQFLRQNQTNKM